MSTATPDADRDDEMFGAELDEIRRRRVLLGLDAARLTAEAPLLARGLTGVAFSGGGVRAACVSLGVAQALARAGVFGRFDYLSTVSGGGYLGGALTSLIGTTDTTTPSVEGDAFPLHLGTDGPEPAALSHVRSFANFLAPEGALGKVRLAAVLIRGAVLNAFLFLPWIVAAVVLTEITYEIESRLGLGDLAGRITLGMLGVALLLVVTFPFVVKIGRGRFTWQGRDKYDMLFAGALMAMLATLAMLPFTRLTRSLVEASWTVVRTDVSHLFATLDRPVVWAGVIVAVLVIAVLRARFAFIGIVLGIVGRASIWALGPALLLAAYFFICVRFVHLPFVQIHYAGGHAYMARDTLLAGALPGDLRMEINRQLDAEGGRLSHLAMIERSPDGQQLWVRDSSWFPRTGADWLFGATNGPDGNTGVARFPIRIRGESTADMDVTVMLRAYPEPRDFLLLAFLLLLVLINGRIVDVNVTSLHEFYRDRLSRAFLLRSTPGGLEGNDGQKLTDLNPTGLAPYHLINATINVSGSTNSLVRGRNADFFLFSKHFSGSGCTGYCPTNLLEHADGRLDLASAMAISGAAASPRMGVRTSGSISGDMALFDLRLGYWIPNPARVFAGEGGYGFRGPGPSYLLREAFGVLHERGRYVNVSDGGHIENLGVYELLRRRCRTIVSLDAESDPSLWCDAMITLIRYARIDLGTEIDIDLTPLRRVSDGESRQHCVVGTIRYGSGPDETGTLVYLKVSLTGDESEAIKAFRRVHPDFPHQSTADQFFNEEDVEAYRALGDHIATMAVQDSGPVGDQLRALAVSGR